MRVPGDSSFFDAIPAAKVPLAEMFSYIAELRNLSKGRANYSSWANLVKLSCINGTISANQSRSGSKWKNWIVSEVALQGENKVKKGHGLTNCRLMKTISNSCFL